MVEWFIDYFYLNFDNTPDAIMSIISIFCIISIFLLSLLCDILKETILGFYYNIKTEELNKIIKDLCLDCKKIIFNNKDIGNTSILVEHINNRLLGEV